MNIAFELGGKSYNLVKYAEIKAQRLSLKSPTFVINPVQCTVYSVQCTVYIIYFLLLDLKTN